MNKVTLVNGVLNVNDKTYYIKESTFERWNDYQINTIIELLSELEVCNLQELFEYDYDTLHLTHIIEGLEVITIIEKNYYITVSYSELGYINFDLLDEVADFLS